jgi:hypothetical protein
MKIKQLSLFIENKPGQLLIPCKILADAGINIITLSLADTQQFGILRLIVKPWQKAKTILEKAGCVVKTTDVIAIDVQDRPGGLAEIIRTIDEARLNIEYMYAFAFGCKEKAVLVFRFDDVDAAIKNLRTRGVNMIESVELYKRAES